MGLSWIDQGIIVIVLATVVGVSLLARHYSQTVSDFLTANRCAGRYLLSVAQGMASMGAVSVVALWEKFYQGGFGSIYWGLMTMPIGLILGMSGFVIYRYRQTRAMTMAQFLEMRYSKRFRVFAGFLCFVSGVLNYGIFPAVTGRFLIYFLDLPVWKFTLLGLELNGTLGLTMAFCLGIALVVALNGGQIAVMVSDFIQGQLTNICFLIIAMVLLLTLSWSDLMTALQSAPAGASKLNPFDQGKLPDFNPMFYIMMAMLSVYQYKAWQGNQGYNASAKSPHEAKMAGVLGEFRALINFFVIPLAAIAAWAVLNSDIMPEMNTLVGGQLEALGQTEGPQLEKQMRTTIFLKEILPVGVLGLMVSVMIMAAVSTDSTYLHSWGAIFIQDVWIPMREIKGKEKLSQEQHLRLLKLAIAGVATFAWFFSMLFPLQEYILMYFMITGAIFTGGAGAVIIGGLYWPRGTTRGAWVGMSVGCSLAVTGIVVVNIIWPWFVPYAKANMTGAWVQALPEKFWINGMQQSFCVAAISVCCYVVTSLLDRKQKAVDFDKLFHRGAYAIAEDEGETQKVDRNVSKWMRCLGITSEFTNGDRVIYILKYIFFGWKFFVCFLAVLISYFGMGLMQTDVSWVSFWTMFIGVIGVVAAISVVWFIIGGTYDLCYLVKALRQKRVSLDDDGSVTEHLGE